MAASTTPHTPVPHRPSVANPTKEDETMDDAIACPAIAARPSQSRAPFAALRGWWRARRMERELHELDDATLKDIGLYRGEIPSVARAHCAEPGGL